MSLSQSATLVKRRLLPPPLTDQISCDRLILQRYWSSAFGFYFCCFLGSWIYCLNRVLKCFVDMRWQKLVNNIMHWIISFIAILEFSDWIKSQNTFLYGLNTIKFVLLCDERLLHRNLPCCSNEYISAYAQNVGYYTTGKLIVSKESTLIESKCLIDGRKFN